MRSIGVRPQAVLWDVDGTLAETERDGHRVAFNRAFEACGLPWRWDDSYYGPLLRVSGGFERLLHDMRVRTDAPARPEARAALAREIHAQKNAFYGELVRSGAIPLRDGVLDLLRQCRDGAMPMGITTTSSRANVDALLAVHLGPDWHAWFAVVICGEDVRHKKPDPEVYVRAVDALGIDPHQALAIEDSPDGAAAARSAGVPVVVARSAYFTEAAIAGATAIGPGFRSRRGWQPAPVATRPANAPIGLDELVTWWGAR